MQRLRMPTGRGSVAACGPPCPPAHTCMRSVFATTGVRGAWSLEPRGKAELIPRCAGQGMCVLLTGWLGCATEATGRSSGYVYEPPMLVSTPPQS
eukprot:317063-Chlamydomonas_euryale.AAC.1